MAGRASTRPVVRRHDRAVVLSRDLSTTVVELLRTQDGLVTRRQLYEAGWSPHDVRWWLRREWSVVLPGVVASFRGRLSARQQLVAASLYAGEGAVITSNTAARWRGSVNAPDDGRVHLFIPLARTLTANPALVIRRSRRPDPKQLRRGCLVFASAARSFADAARDAPSVRDARAVVIESVQRELVTIEELRVELDDGPRCGSALLRAGIDAAASGAWSVPEHDLLQVLRSSGRFPVVWANPVLQAPDGTRLPTPDCWLDDVGLAIQVHSRRHHFGVADWEHTLHQDGVFAEYGVPVIAITPQQLRASPSGVLARISRAHAARRGSARPNVIATPRV